MVVIEQVRGVVQHVTIHLAQRDHGLKRVSHGTLGSDQIGNVIGHGTPSKLDASMSAKISLSMLLDITYCCDCLHAEHEWV